MWYDNWTGVIIRIHKSMAGQTSARPDREVKDAEGNRAGGDF